MVEIPDKSLVLRLKVPLNLTSNTIEEFYEFEKRLRCVQQIVFQEDYKPETPPKTDISPVASIPRFMPTSPALMHSRQPLDTNTPIHSPPWTSIPRQSENKILSSQLPSPISPLRQITPTHAYSSSSSSTSGSHTSQSYHHSNIPRENEFSQPSSATNHIFHPNYTSTITPPHVIQQLQTQKTPEPQKKLEFTPSAQNWYHAPSQRMLHTETSIIHAKSIEANSPEVSQSSSPLYRHSPPIIAPAPIPTPPQHHSSQLMSIDIPSSSIRIQPSHHCLHTLSNPPSSITKVAVLSLLVELDHLHLSHDVNAMIHVPRSRFASNPELPCLVLAHLFTFATLQDLYSWCRVNREWAKAIQHSRLWITKCAMEVSIEFQQQVLPRLSPNLVEDPHRVLYRWTVPPLDISTAPCKCCGHIGGHKMVDVFLCLGCSRRPEYSVLTKRQLSIQYGLTWKDVLPAAIGVVEKRCNAVLMIHVWRAFSRKLRNTISTQLRRARLADHWKYHDFFDEYINKKSVDKVEIEAKRAAELVRDFKRMLIEEAKRMVIVHPIFFHAWMLACQNEEAKTTSPPMQHSQQPTEQVPPTQAFTAHIPTSKNALPAKITAHQQSLQQVSPITTHWQVPMTSYGQTVGWNDRSSSFFNPPHDYGGSSK
jgi:hypothetical protein